jgi:hypothetical protein
MARGQEATRWRDLAELATHWQPGEGSSTKARDIWPTHHMAISERIPAPVFRQVSALRESNGAHVHKLQARTAIPETEAPWSVRGREEAAVHFWGAKRWSRHAWVYYPSSQDLQ